MLRIAPPCDADAEHLARFGPGDAIRAISVPPCTRSLKAAFPRSATEGVYFSLCRTEQRSRPMTRCRKANRAGGPERAAGEIGTRYPDNP
jgi:hypothetical protein